MWKLHKRRFYVGIKEAVRVLPYSWHNMDSPGSVGLELAVHRSGSNENVGDYCDERIISISMKTKRYNQPVQGQK